MTDDIVFCIFRPTLTSSTSLKSSVRYCAADTMLPLAQRVRELYERAVQNGLGQLDFSVIAQEQCREQLG